MTLRILPTMSPTNSSPSNPQSPQPPPPPPQQRQQQQQQEHSCCGMDNDAQLAAAAPDVNIDVGVSHHHHHHHNNNNIAAAAAAAATAEQPQPPRMQMTSPQSLLRKQLKRLRTKNNNNNSSSKKDPAAPPPSYHLPPGVMGMDHEAALQVIHRAMNALPAEDTEAYRQACHECPARIREESPPACFLEFEKGDAKRAAKRLAMYWKIRLAHFGPDRAYRKLMDLSGSGCLNPQDLQVMKIGIFVPLPADQEGRCIFFSDQTRIPDGMKRIIERLRCIFFFYHLPYFNMASAASWRKGVTFIRTVNKAFFSKDGVRMLVDFINGAFPFQLHSLHMCCLSPAEPSEKSTFWSRINPATRRLLQFFYRAQPVVHQKDTTADLLQSLCRYGFEKESLPPSVGGEWSYSKFYLWLRQKELHGFVVAPATEWELSLPENQQEQGQQQEQEQDKPDSLLWTATDNYCNYTPSIVLHRMSNESVESSVVLPRAHPRPAPQQVSSSGVGVGGASVAARKSFKSKLDAISARRHHLLRRSTAASVANTVLS